MLKYSQQVVIPEEKLVWQKKTMHSILVNIGKSIGIFEKSIVTACTMITVIQKVYHLHILALSIDNVVLEKISNINYTN